MKNLLRLRRRLLNVLQKVNETARAGQLRPKQMRKHPVVMNNNRNKINKMVKNKHSRTMIKHRPRRLNHLRRRGNNRAALGQDLTRGDVTRLAPGITTISQRRNQANRGRLDRGNAKRRGIVIANAKNVVNISKKPRLRRDTEISHLRRLSRKNLKI